MCIRDRLLPDVREHERLAMGERPHLVACRECAPIADRLVERAVAALLGLRDDRCGACALRLVVDVYKRQEIQGYLIDRPLPCEEFIDKYFRGL